MESSGRHLLKKIGSSFKGAFQKNWFLMVMSLLIGMLLWGYVLAYLNPIRTKRIPGVIISLEGTNDLLSRNLIVVSSNMEKATVTVSAELNRHAEIDATRVNCIASVNKITAEGDYTLPLVGTVPSGLGTVASVSPDNIRVVVDRLITKTVPVQLQYAGELPEGYSVSSEYYEPSLLTLEGAARYIEPVHHAVATVDLTGLTNDFEGAVDVLYYDKEGEELTVVTRNKQEHSIIVRVRITAHKELPILLDMTAPDPEYYDTSYAVSHASVTVWGDWHVLKALEAIYTEHVELTSDMWGSTFECALLIPEGVTLKPGAPGNVKATVTVSERIYELAFTVPVKPENLGRGLAVAAMDAGGTVEVTVRGTKSQLDALTAADIMARVDLSGRGAGTHTLSVTLSIVKKGYSGLTLSASPESITVTLR